MYFQWFIIGLCFKVYAFQAYIIWLGKEAYAHILSNIEFSIVIEKSQINMQMSTFTKFKISDIFPSTYTHRAIQKEVGNERSPLSRLQKLT